MPTLRLSHGSRKVLHLREAQPDQLHRPNGASPAIAAFHRAGAFRLSSPIRKKPGILQMMALPSESQRVYIF
jgi:hypothetical protein